MTRSRLLLLTSGKKNRYQTELVTSGKKRRHQTKLVTKREIKREILKTRNFVRSNEKLMKEERVTESLSAALGGSSEGCC